MKINKVFSWRRLRLASQWLFLLIFLFLFLQTEGKGADELGWPVRLFLDFNPLILLTTLLSAQSVPVAFLLSLLMVVITLGLGRVFCGWICPLGTLHNLVSQTTARGRALVRHPAWFKFKYYLLAAMLALAALGSQQAGLLDPISLLIRSLAVSIYPAFSLTLSALFDALYHADLRGLTALSERLYAVLRDTVLPFQQGFFRQSMAIGLIFGGLLALNLYERRFWCRYLCPLGALLGLLARWSLLRREVAEGCTNCGACGSNCPGGAEPRSQDAAAPATGWRPSECHACFNCDDLCPHHLVKFKLGRPARPWGRARPEPQSEVQRGLNLDRRRLVTAAVAGMAMLPLMRVGNLPQARANPLLIRPPGSSPEREFLSRCVKCGECMKVCLTGGLQPTLLEAGVEGLWTPLLVPRRGYCEYHCTLCGQVCPTGAIKRLSVEEKTSTRIGLAMFDRDRCLPWAYGIPCIVCEEVCPTSKKAIWFEEVAFIGRDGESVRVQRPHVDLELCIGCGICETMCPVTDKPAVYVTSIGESRSHDNQLLL